MVEILAVDDAHEDLLLLERVIRKAKIVNPVHLFGDPVQLLSYLYEQPEQAEPVLLFVDLVMHPRNGVEVLRALKNHPLMRRSISVMLSGMSDVRNIRLAYEAGATTFFIKPLAVEDLENFFRAFSRYFTILETPTGRQIEWTPGKMNPGTTSAEAHPS